MLITATANVYAPGSRSGGAKVEAVYSSDRFWHPAPMPVTSATSPFGEDCPSPVAHAVARGTQRLLASLGLACVSELPLASGRRADLVAIGGDGEVWIIEIKSSVADFRADHKWPDYRLHCDRLFFATAPHVPAAIFPEDAGLIIADGFGGVLERDAPVHRLHSATRRSLLLTFARAAALRLQAVADPTGRYEGLT